jgi:hypothetical protein
VNLDVAFELVAVVLVAVTCDFQINVLLTVHRDISAQQEPTGCTIYFQFISIINLYMF